jgi:hypothetical protein
MKVLRQTGRAGSSRHAGANGERAERAARRREPNARTRRGVVPRPAWTCVPRASGRSRGTVDPVSTVLYGDFEWDDEKAETNAVKHGIGFEEGVSFAS